MRGRAPAVKGANMPFISIVCNLVQIAEVVKRDALVDTEKEFFAALNAALGIGRDDAPWQWALNSGNARLAGIAQAAIGNWSAEEKITNETADSVCSPRAGTLACDAVKAFNEYSRTRMLAAQQATEAIAPDATKRRAAWRTTTQTESRKPKHSGTLCLAATESTSARAKLQSPCTVNGKDPEGGPIKSGEQTDAGAVAEQWDKLNPAVCHAPHKNRTFHDGEDEHAIALFRYNLQDRKSGAEESTHSATATTSTRTQTQVASATKVTWHLAKRKPRGWTTSAPQQRHSELHGQHTTSQKSTSTKSSKQSTGCKTRTHTELTQTKKHETLSAPRTQHSAKAKKVQATQPGKEARAQAKTQTRNQ
ncbi:hypothetical protein ERJ75_001756100 [Trypanosoma vivax]|nr:hypothetical protein ERJ75_001756100 [Trypanosoma vivax]